MGEGYSAYEIRNPKSRSPATTVNSESAGVGAQLCYLLLLLAGLLGYQLWRGRNQRAATEPARSDQGRYNSRKINRGASIREPE